jgi:acyl-CoA reductase-like NAD-dependent aldehyde dehydrogenase
MVMKVAPALMAGNTIIVKLAPTMPLTTATRTNLGRCCIQ